MANAWKSSQVSFVVFITVIIIMDVTIVVVIIIAPVYECHDPAIKKPHIIVSSQKSPMMAHDGPR
jgi:hypothetical protein